MAVLDPQHLSFCRLTARTVLGPSMMPVPMAVNLRHQPSLNVRRLYVGLHAQVLAGKPAAMLTGMEQGAVAVPVQHSTVADGHLRALSKQMKAAQ